MCQDDLTTAHTRRALLRGGGPVGLSALAAPTPGGGNAATQTHPPPHMLPPSGSGLPLPGHVARTACSSTPGRAVTGTPRSRSE